MLKDIFDITYHNAKVVIRIFDMTDGHIGEYEDVEITFDNVDYYNGEFEVSCIVPMDNKLLIEGTI